MTYIVILTCSLYILKARKLLVTTFTSTSRCQESLSAPPQGCPFRYKWQTLLLVSALTCWDLHHCWCALGGGSHAVRHNLIEQHIHAIRPSAERSNVLWFFVPHNALNALKTLHMPFFCSVYAEFNLHRVFSMVPCLRAVLPSGSSLALCVWQHYYENPALGEVPDPC